MSQGDSGIHSGSGSGSWNGDWERGRYRGEGTKVAWQSRLDSPQARLRHLLHDSHLADLTIIFPNRQHPPLKVHRLVLAMSSPVFEKKLYGKGSTADQITCPDPPDAFVWLLDHLYCGSLYLPSLHLACQVALLARKYRLHPLAAHCSKVLEGQVTEKTVLRVLNTAHYLQDPTILRHCSKVVEHCAEGVLCSPWVANLLPGALTRLLDFDLNVREHVIFACVVTWGRARVGGGRGITLREAVAPFLPRVRFLAMSAEEYVCHVMPSGVFMSDEDTAILLHIIGRTDVPLPHACSTLAATRI